MLFTRPLSVSVDNLRAFWAAHTGPRIRGQYHSLLLVFECNMSVQTRIQFCCTGILHPKFRARFRPRIRGLGYAAVITLFLPIFACSMSALPGTIVTRTFCTVILSTF